ncbi:MAG: riboflavin synthase [Candidatus Aminicenantes bacterium]|nr:MAG: riboflavin synthase [Candidatus Aminicenantes bacterium]
MFTGIISHMGIFKEYRKGKQEMVIETSELASRLEIGDSLAVNGVCLSLTRKEKNMLSFDLSKETLSRTNLGSLRRDQQLNLEISLTLSSPLSGHLVTGHIDSTGKVKAIQKKGTGIRITIAFPTDLSPYLISKGSVAIDGVSLTIAKLFTSSLVVEIIPITLKKSNLSLLKPGNTVNLECDIIGKYVYNWLSKTKGKSK